MDEPAAGLHEAEIPAFAAVVRSVHADFGAGVLLIDHNVALIMDVCDRIHVLDRGMTLAEGTPAGDPAQPRRRDRLPRRRRRRRDAMAEPALELREIEVRYGRLPAVRNLSLERRPRRDRRPDRAQRRRQVDDAARDHGPRPARRRRDPAARRARCAASPRTARAPASALVPEGRHIFASLTVEENLRLGLSGAALDGRRRRRPRLGHEPLPGGRASSPTAWRARSRAASSSSSRSRAR